MSGTHTYKERLLLGAAFASIVAAAAAVYELVRAPATTASGDRTEINVNMDAPTTHARLAETVPVQHASDDVIAGKPKPKQDVSSTDPSPDNSPASSSGAQRSVQRRSNLVAPPVAQPSPAIASREREAVRQSESRSPPEEFEWQ